MTLFASRTFARAASAKAAPKRRRPSPLSIRLSDEERAILERKAGNRPLGAYVREQVLGEQVAPRRKGRGKPSLDAVLLGKLLGTLGKSDQVNCLFLLLAAAQTERVKMARKERAALQDACADVREMRALLIKALGLRSDGR